MSSEGEPIGNQPELNFESARSVIKGVFIGKIDEIEFEIEKVYAWETDVKLGHTIRRRKSELESLNRLKEEMVRTGNKVLEILGGSDGLIITPNTNTMIDTDTNSAS